LKGLPGHTSREILALMGSLSTCDPIDINTTVEELKKEKIRCSVISLSAEVHVYRMLTQQTNGVFGSVLDDSHFRDLLTEHVDPPAAASNLECSLIKMGFPSSFSESGKDPPLSMCACHIDNPTEPSKLTTRGHFCPECNSKYCELPVECRICGLTLISAPHLTRSYHHLFPVKPFKEIEFHSQTANCFGCQRALTDATDKFIYRCELCLQYYCCDCDVFIHDTLHTCAGCTTIPRIANQIYNMNSKQNNFFNAMGKHF